MQTTKIAIDPFWNSNYGKWLVNISSFFFFHYNLWALFNIRNNVNNKAAELVFAQIYVLFLLGFFL